MSERVLALEFFIAGAIMSPNELNSLMPVKRRALGPSRWSVTHDMRDKAHVVSMQHARSKRLDFKPPVHMVFQIHRRYLLDFGDNERTALKAYRDGIVSALLPGSSDGPKSGNTFAYLPQVQVQDSREEGVNVKIYRVQ